MVSIVSASGLPAAMMKTGLSSWHRARQSGRFFCVSDDKGAGPGVSTRDAGLIFLQEVLVAPMTCCSSGPVFQGAGLVRVLYASRRNDVSVITGRQFLLVLW